MVHQDQFERQLRERKAYLEGALDRFERALEAPPNPDAEDRATEREGDEVLEGLGSSGLAELRQIDAAARADRGRQLWRVRQLRRADRREAAGDRSARGTLRQMRLKPRLRRLHPFAPVGWG